MLAYFIENLKGLRNISLLLFSVLLLTHCNQLSNQNSSPSESLSKEFGLKLETYSPISEQLISEVRIPFLDGETYYLADYNGDRISKDRFKDIVLFDFVPSFMAKRNDEYSLYAFPESPLFPQTFKGPLKRSNFKLNASTGSFDRLIFEGKEIDLNFGLQDSTELIVRNWREEKKIKDNLKNRRFLTSSPMGHHTDVFRLNTDEYILKLNDNLEVVFENRPIFIKVENLDLEQIPSGIRPDPSKVRTPSIIQPFIVVNDGSYGHVFTSQGKYLSSHEGWYNEQFSINGLYRRKEFRHEYLPIAQFKLGGYIYYVRLTDGYEYRNKY